MVDKYDKKTPRKIKIEKKNATVTKFVAQFLSSYVVSSSLTSVITFINH